MDRSAINRRIPQLFVFFSIILLADAQGGPIITNCPADPINVNAAIGETSTAVNWSVPVATSTVGGFVLQVADTPSPGDLFDVPSNTNVSYIFLDFSTGTAATCNFEIIVRASPVGPPVISNCPTGPVEVTARPGETTTAVTWTVPTAVSPAGGFVLQISDVPSPGDQFDVPSTTPVTYTFLDITASMIPVSSCSFDIIVLASPVGPPVISNCPTAPVEVTAGPGETTTAVTWTVPTAVSPTGGFVLQISDVPSPGDQFDVPSTTPVTYTFLDITASMIPVSSCSFDIIVLEPVDTGFMIVSCPAEPIEISAPSGVSSLPVTYMEPEAVGGVTVLLISNPPRSGSNFDVPSNNRVNYFYLDVVTQQFEICIFDIILTEEVTDDIIISDCPNDISRESLNGQRVPVFWIEPTAQSGGNPVSPTRSHFPGQSFPVGETDVTYSFSSSGMTEICSFRITVTASPVGPPVISNCPTAPVEVTAGPGETTTAVTWTVPTAVSPTGGFVLQISDVPSPGDQFDVPSTTPVTYTFLDITASMIPVSSCSFDIIVLEPVDTGFMIVSCPAEPIEISAPSGVSSLPVTYMEPEAVGGVTVLLISNPPRSGSNFDVPSNNRVNYFYLDVVTQQFEICIFDIILTEEVTDDIIISDCPNDISRESLNGQRVPVFWIEPTAQSGGNPVSPTRSHFPGQSFPVGETDVTYSFSSSGMTEICSFRITVTGGPPTVVDCPGLIEETIPLGSSSTTIFWREPTASSNAGGFITTERSHIPGSSFSPGETTVTYTFTDNPSGLTAECEFLVIITFEPDTTPPVIDCPGDVSQPVPCGQSGASVVFNEPTATDNSGSAFSVGNSPSSGDLFPVGTTPVTFTFSDSAGNTAECVFDVRVFFFDTTPPTVNCMDDIEETSGPGGRIVDFIEPTATDDSGPAVLVSGTMRSGDFFPLGKTTVTFVFEDLCGNTVECSFCVTLTEEVQPGGIVNCPESDIVRTATGTSSLSVFWDEPAGSSGNIFLLSQTHSPGDSFDVGSVTTVTYLFLDLLSSTILTCAFDIVVNGTSQSPTVLGCPGDITELASCGSGQVTVTWTLPTAVTSTGDEAITLIQSHAPGTSFGVPSETDVQYVFVDIQNGLRATCEFTITVEETTNTPPSQPMPCQPISRLVTSPSTSERVFFDPRECNDAEDGTTEAICTPASGSLFNLGVTTVFCFCRDSCGDSSQCSFEIDVEQGSLQHSRARKPNQELAITTASTATPGENSPGTQLEFELGTAASCRAYADTTLPLSHSIGMTTVMCTCRDSEGASDVYVNNPPAVPVCPSVQPATSFQGDFGQFVTFPAPPCSDEEDGQLGPAMCNPSSGSLFEVRTTTVMCSCTDSDGSSSNCMFDVQVLPFVDEPCQPNPCLNGGTCIPLIGNDPPFLCLCDEGFSGSTCGTSTNNPPFDPVGCPSFASPFTSMQGNTGRVVEWQRVTCFDIEDGVLEAQCVPVSGTRFPVGTSAVTCTCTDSEGATSVCRFNVDVLPVQDLACVNVPDPIIRSVNPDQAGDSIVFQAPSCNSEQAVLSCSRQSPIFVRIDTTTTVVCTCTDGPNMVTCSFPITVVTSGPVEIQVMNCPSTTIVITPTTEMDSLGVFWSEPFAISSSSNEVVPIASQTHSPGDLFVIPSVTTVTYAFAFGSVSAACRFDVQVDLPARVRIERPCPEDFTTVADPGVISIPVEWTPPTAVNEVGQVVPVSFQSHFPGANFPVPSTTRVNYVFSSRGVSNSCSFRVTTRSRVVPPTIRNCPNDIEVTAPATGTRDRAVVTWDEVEAVTFTGQPAELASATHMSRDVFLVGTTAVVLVYTNPGSETPTATCAFMVTVLPPPPPPTLVSCPDDITQRSSSGNPIPITWSTPTAVTSVGEFATISSRTHRSGESFPVGRMVVFIMLLDSAPSGQTVTCVFTVNILPPLRPPTIRTCPDDIMLISTSGSGLDVNYETPTAVTQSGRPASTVSQSHFPGENFPIGKTDVQYTFADLENPGASPAVCSFCITIELLLPDPPIIVTCPSPAPVGSPSGGGLAVSWTPPTAISQGMFSTLQAQTHRPGDFFPRGSTLVVYVFGDPVVPTVTSSCEFTVTVLGPPALVDCPRDTTGISPSGVRIDVPFDPPVAFTDSGDMARLQSQTPAVIIPFPVGITPVEYVFEDPRTGLTVTCQFTVSVLGPPEVLNCLPNQEVIAVGESVTVNWVPPTAVSSLGDPIDAVASHQPGTNFPAPSTTTITYTFTDQLSNILTAECVFDIIVVRPPPPTVVDCPSNIIRSGPAGPTIVDWSPPRAVSDSGQPVPCNIVSDRPSPFMIPSTSTIVYLCTDSLGASSTCIFDVVLTIALSPPQVFDCPEDIILDGPPGATSVTITWREPTAATSSGLPAEVSSSSSPGQVFPIPSDMLVTYTFTDPLLDLQNTDCSFSVILSSTPADTPPTIFGCPADVRLRADNADMISVSWTEPTAVSNIGGDITVMSTHVTGTSFPVPSATSVTYTFTDSGNGRSSDCQFLVVVSGLDTIPPTIMDCPGAFLINTPLSFETIAVTWVEPTATDRGQPVIGTSNFQPGDQFTVNVPTNVEYTFTDAAGNSDQCSFTVRIIRVDEEPPVISNCPEQISLTAVTGNTVMSITWVEPTATDNFGEVTVTASHQPGTEFAVDTSTIITYTFTDGAGNDARCVFTVSLTSAPDDPPVIEGCPDNIALQPPAGSVTSSVAWIEPTGTDDNGPVTSIASHRPNSLFPVGRTTTIIYTFMDNAGQTSVCLFTITLTALPDNNPPVVTGCPMPVIFERVPTGSLTLLVDWDEPSATDEESMVQTTQTHTPPVTAALGDRLDVNYRFSDGPNTVDCAFTVFVLPPDNTPPVFQNCPGPITQVALQTDFDMSVVSWEEPIATDDISQPVTITVNLSPGSSFPIGTPVTVTYTAIDSAAVPNFAECEFDVLVQPFDMVAPIIEGCSGPITVAIGPDQSEASVSWDPPTTSDVTAMVESTHNPGDNFPLGTTQVVYTFIDNAGNTATCDFSVFVVADSAAPMFQVPCPPGDITMTSSYDLQVTEVAITDLWPTPVAVDRFTNVTTEVDVTPDYQRFEEGVLPVDGITRIIQYTFSDDFDNTRNCFFAVTLSEMQPLCAPPVFQNCPSEFFSITAQPNVEVSRVWDEVIATANCSLTITSDPENTETFTLTESEIVRIEITATNEDDLSSTCEFFVSITIDGIAPEIQCPPDVMATVPTDQDLVQIVWEVTATDNSGTVMLDRDGPASGDMFGPGQVMVTYTATDPAGKTATCSFNVIITVEPVSTDPPRLPPMVVNCTSGTLIRYTNIASPQMISFPTAGAVDADGNDITGVLDIPNQFVARIDPYDVSFTFTDGFGLTSTCQYQLMLILDTEPPVIVGCPMMTLFGTLFPNQVAATVDIPTVSATDSVDPNDIIGVMDPAGNEFGLGDTNVTISFTDQAGNVGVCLFTVTVNMNPCDPSPCSGIEVCSFDQDTFDVSCVPSSCEDYFCDEPAECVEQQNGLACVVRSCRDANCDSPCVEALEQAVCTGANPCGVDGCDEGQSCLAGFCIRAPQPCPPCGPGQICERGLCVDLNICPEPCAEGQLCELGMCVDVDPCQPNPCTPPQTCSPDDAGGFTCSNVPLCATVSCEPPATCNENIPGNVVCVVTCNDVRSSCDLLPGQVCVEVNNAPVCINETTLDVVDCVQADCGGNQQCQGGICVPVPVTLPVDEVCYPACPDGQTCVNNLCSSDSEDTAPTLRCEDSQSTGVVEASNLPMCTDRETPDDQLVLNCNVALGTPLSAGDNEVSQIVKIYRHSVALGTTLSAGDNEVTCTCSDGVNPDQTCTYTISVPGTPPTLSCENSVSAGIVREENLPTCTDAETPDQLTIDCNIAAGEFLSPGENSIQCTCTDSDGDSDTCSYTINVLGDDTAPTLRCEDSQSTGVVEASNLPMCTDTETPDDQLVLNCNVALGTPLSAGDNEVMCTCSDGVNPEQMCTYTINVPEQPTTTTLPPTTTTEPPTTTTEPPTTTTEPSTTTTEPPTITTEPPTTILGPTPPTLSCENSLSTERVTEENLPTCTDAETPASQLAINCNVAVGQALSPGENNIQCTCADSDGDSDTCSYTLTNVCAGVCPGTLPVCYLDEIGQPQCVATACDVPDACEVGELCFPLPDAEVACFDPGKRKRSVSGSTAYEKHPAAVDYSMSSYLVVLFVGFIVLFLAMIYYHKKSGRSTQTAEV